MKDNISVAGIPMRNGCFTLEGYIPDVDATVVNRVLDNGKKQKILINIFNFSQNFVTINLKI